MNHVDLHRIDPRRRVQLGEFAVASVQPEDPLSRWPVDLLEPAETLVDTNLLAAPRSTSQLCTHLFSALEQNGVRYCHWKSNVRLSETMAGREDIDVLVHPADADLFRRVLNGCGFKLAVAPWGAGHPGVFHALAWDPQLGRLLDVHAYHQLVSGDSFVKSYRFPVEEVLLESAVLLRGVRVPEPAAELVLFLLRTLLKHVNIVELHKVTKSFAESRSELAWLLARTELADAERWREQAFPTLAVTVAQMAECVCEAAVSARVALGMRVAWALRRQRRIGHVAASASRAIRVTRHFATRVRGRRNLSLLSGGAWIAVVGPKGSGKSTLGRLLAKRLATNLNVETVHLGKPPPGPLTFLPALLRPVLRRLLPNERMQAYEQPGRRLERRYSTPFVIRKLLLAMDRERLLTRCLREVAAGTIVISDRCPAVNATGLDGSAFDEVAIARASSPLQRWMMQQERAIYRRLPRPRLVLKLDVPLAVALERDQHRNKLGGPDPGAILRRFSLESGAEFARSAVCTIDAGGDLESTGRQAMKCIWQAV